MAGLLDFNLDDPQQAGMMALAQGLLAAGAPQSRRVGFGEALAQGMGGMMQARQQAKGLQQQNAANDLAMKMKQFQFGGMQQEAAARQAQQAFQAKLPEIIRQYGNDYQGMIRDYPAAAEYVKQVADARNLGRDEVARTQEVEGANGEKLIRSFTKFGDVAGQDQSGYVAPVQVNRGDQISMVKPAAGLNFKMGLSPSDMMADSRARAQMAQSERQFQLGRMDKANPKQAPMTATLQKELIETDDVAQASKNVIDALKDAKSINNKAYSGWGANTRANIVSNLGGTDSADATVALNNLTTGQALENLKLVFGGMPTEGERKILMEMQASADKTPKQRADILDRAIKLAEIRGKYADAKSKAIRTGSYLTEGVPVPETRTQPNSKAPMKGQVMDGYKFKGGNPADPNSWEQM